VFGGYDLGQCRLILEGLLFMAEKTELPIPVLEDAASRLVFIVEQVTGCAFHKSVFVLREVFSNCRVAVLASEDDRMSLDFLVVSLWLGFMAIIALMDNRVDTSVLNGLQQIDGFVGVVTISTTSGGILDFEKREVLGRINLWEVPWACFQFTVAEQTPLQGVLLGEDCLLCRDVRVLT
jgi:hypothetical protein